MNCRLNLPILEYEVLPERCSWYEVELVRDLLGYRVVIHRWGSKALGDMENYPM